MKWAFTTWYGSNWHPLTWLSHMLDASLFGADIGAQHFVNVLFHAANAVLLFLLLLRMTGKNVAGGIRGGVVCLASVARGIGRVDFGAKGCAEHVFWAADVTGVWEIFGKFQSSKVPNSKAWYSYTLVLFALSLMAKPMLVTLPFVMLLLDIWPLESNSDFCHRRRN